MSNINYLLPGKTVLDAINEVKKLPVARPSFVAKIVPVAVELGHAKVFTMGTAFDSRYLEQWVNYIKYRDQKIEDGEWIFRRAYSVGDFMEANPLTGDITPAIIPHITDSSQHTRKRLGVARGIDIPDGGGWRSSILPAMIEVGHAIKLRSVHALDGRMLPSWGYYLYKRQENIKDGEWSASRPYSVADFKDTISAYSGSLLEWERSRQPTETS